MRSRQSGFPQRRCIELHAKEAEACLKLQSMGKLVDSYIFHRSANEFQKPILTELLGQPPPQSVVVLSDFKELVTLPIRAVQTGEEFYANSRKEISVFGAIISERKSDADDAVLWTRVLVIADILDHTSCRASQCIEQVLKKRRGTGACTTIHLMSDPGPHFRSYEQLHHACCVMPFAHKARICVHFGVEKHFKSEADRLFALFETYVRHARTQQTDLVEVADLCTYLRDRNEQQRRRDPTAPFLEVLDDSSSLKRPAGERRRLVIKHFQITKSYCISAVANSYTALGVRIFNHIYSSMPISADITSEVSLGPTTDVAADYRRGFWGEGRTRWDHQVAPLGIHEETALTRRQAAQSQVLPGGADSSFSVTPVPCCLIEKRQKKADKAKARQAERKRLLAEDASDSTSSTSDTSSDDSDAQ